MTRDEGVAVFPEVDAVPGSKIDPVFEDAGADTLGTGEVSQFHPKERCCHLRRGGRVEIDEPFLERARVPCVEKLPDRHPLMVTHTLPFAKTDIPWV